MEGFVSVSYYGGSQKQPIQEPRHVPFIVTFIILMIVLSYAERTVRRNC